jgi:hypothetical protein
MKRQNMSHREGEENMQRTNSIVLGLLIVFVLGGSLVLLRGYPKTNQQRHAYIKQHSCGNERQGDRMGQAYEA